MVEIYEHQTKAELKAAAQFGKPDYPESAYGLMIGYLRSIRFAYENAPAEELRKVAKDWLHDLVYNNPKWPAGEKISELLESWIHALRYGSNRLSGNNKSGDDHIEHLQKWLLARPASMSFVNKKPEPHKKYYDKDAPLPASVTPSDALHLLWNLGYVYGRNINNLPKVDKQSIPNMHLYASKLYERAGHPERIEPR